MDNLDNLPVITDWSFLPLLLSMPDVMAVLRVSRDTAFRFVHEPGFPVLRVGKQLRIPRELFREWVEDQARLGLADEDTELEAEEERLG